MPSASSRIGSASTTSVAREITVSILPGRSRREAKQHTDHASDAGREERDREGRPGAVRDPHEEVTARVVDAEVVARRRLLSGPGHQVGAEGAELVERFRFTWLGAWPVQLAIAARSAIRIIRMMITTPPSAKRSLRKWRQKISQGLRPMIDAGISADGADSRSARSSTSRCSTSETSVSVSERLMPEPGY